MRFSLKSMLVTVMLAALCVATYVHFAPRPLPVRQISCEQPWSDVAASTAVVAFVDADFNGFTGFYSNVYERFCRWHLSGFRENAILIDTTSGSGETWDKLQQTWRDLNVHTGSFKTFGGAGQVVWVKNGKVVDTVFLPDSDFDELKGRTVNNFN